MFSAWQEKLNSTTPGDIAFSVVLTLAIINVFANL